jgi:hypothetical protein
MLDLRLGRYQDVLQDVTCDFLCADPPYGSRTHAGTTQAVVDRFAATLKTALCYSSWTPDDVAEVALAFGFWFAERYA